MKTPPQWGGYSESLDHRLDSPHRLRLVAGVLTTHQQKENTMTATASPSRSVGERVELGRYRTTTSERILHGQRINGVVRITDTPVCRGRAFLVERGLEEDGYAALQALVNDYITQSQRRDEPAILVNLEHLTDQQ
jgi:hypothetical protein